MTELQQLTNDLSNEVRALTTQLEEANKKADGYLQQLLETRDKYIRQDYTVENQRKALENTRKTLERYEVENKALRKLVELWI